MLKGTRIFKTRTSGFTLLEVIIAVVIMASGILLIAMSWSGAFHRLRKTQTNTEIVALLERKMAELDAKYKGRPLEAIQDSEEDDFGSEYPQYSWKMESRKFEMPDLTGYFTAREGGADQMTLQTMKIFTEHLKQTIKEVRVTVFYKPPNKPEQSYSITTFYVEYNRPLPIPNMGGAGGGGGQGGAVGPGGGG